MPLSSRLARRALSLAVFAALCVSGAEAVAPNSVRVDAGSTRTGNYLAALIASADRDSAAAAVYYREALRSDPRNLDLTERAFASALAAGDGPAAFMLAERLLTHDAGNSLARLSLAVRAIGEGQWSAARIQLAAGDAGKSHDITSNLVTAWSWAGSGDLRRALEAIDQIHDRGSDVFRNYYAGLIADVLGNPVEARRRLELAYSGDKNILRLADGYARFLARHNDVEAARHVYAEFSKTLPNHPVIKAALADLAAGKPLAPTVATARDGAAETLYGLGGANSTRQGDELAALIYLRLALMLRPDHDLAAVTVANLLSDMKQNEAAIRAYESVPKTSPMRESAEIQAALEVDTLGRSAEATTRMKAIVEAYPGDPDAWSSLGSLQRAAKNFGDAAKSYDRAITLIPVPDEAQWTLFYFRGICLERDKQWPRAEADFKKALDIKPDQPLVLNYLGYSWVDQGVNLDDAFKMLQRAVDLKPTDGYIVDSLGWAHFKLGHYDDAVKELERAIELKPADPVVNDHLGDAYWRVGRTIEAHFQWNHARDMDPDPEDKPNILKKIAEGLPDLATAAPPPAATDAPATPPAATDAPAPNSGG